MLQFLTRLFPLWAILFSTYAYWQPAWLATQKNLIVPCLMIIMFGMGMTLTAVDFARVLQRPLLILLGVLLQFLWMPLLAFLISGMLGLSTELTVGMVLVGSVAGGTASNVICYLARGDVALSISMTLVSTLVAVVATPLLTWVYVGQGVPVPVLDMLLSLLRIVLVPVTAGVLINQLLGQRIRAVQSLFPLLSVGAIVYVIGIIVALNAGRLADMGWILAVAVMMHNLGGLLSGYASARLLKQPPLICRTIAIEVGMQNSGLAVALASQYFTPASAIPGALFSIWHNLSGSILAAWWSRRTYDPESLPNIA